MSSTTPPFPSIPPLSAQFAEALPDLCAPWSPVPFSDATLLILNDQLAEELGFDPQWLRSDEGLRFLLGEATSSDAKAFEAKASAEYNGATGTPPDVSDTSSDNAPVWPHPVSQAYSGHQFGSFSPVLGDGRAVLLGEVEVARDDVEPGEGPTKTLDIHLKGSGRTPFSRGNSDGRACLGPMLREYVVSEAMHAMGIPTTRALAVILTGETVMRQTPEPGAVLVRVASSHLRVGSFQCARMLHDKKPHILEDLLEFALQRHGAETSSEKAPETVRSSALQLLDAVAQKQAYLIAQWMRVGFVHGVMNTDNVTISGETIDYGPCAFLDAFDSATSFSSIDTQGRYAFGRQPQIMIWNLQRFAEALLPLIEVQESTNGVPLSTDDAVTKANEVLLKYPEYFSNAWQANIGAALGLVASPCSSTALSHAPLSPSQVALVDEFIAQISEAKADLLGTLNSLARSLLNSDASNSCSAVKHDAQTHTPDSSNSASSIPERSVPERSVPERSAPDWLNTDWLDRWRAENPDPELMLRTNPVRIPRNHLVEESLAAAHTGELTPFEDLLSAVTNPFETVEEITRGVDTEGDKKGADSKHRRNGAISEKYRQPAPQDFGPYNTYCGT